MRFFSYAAIVAGTLGLLMSQAVAVHQGPQPAPAPLLGAGIPAFFALGGGVLIARLRARRRKPAEGATSDQSSGDFEQK
jgi:peptidoglycan/LPS O-acetylase OafA/YrhL